MVIKTFLKGMRPINSIKKPGNTGLKTRGFVVQ
jgi:hypothetical protein